MTLLRVLLISLSVAAILASVELPLDGGLASFCVIGRWRLAALLITPRDKGVPVLPSEDALVGAFRGGTGAERL